MWKEIKDYFKAHKAKVVAAIVFSCLFSVASSIGTGYDQAASWDTVPPISFMLFGGLRRTFTLFGNAIVLSVIALAFFYIWERGSANTPKGSKTAKTAKSKKTIDKDKKTAIGKKLFSKICERYYSTSTKNFFLVTLLIIFVLWLPWIISHYPGTIRDDTWTQLFQWYGIVNYYDQHPVFDTLVFGIFFSLGDILGDRTLGMFIFILVQSLATGAGFAACAAYMRYCKVPPVLVVLGVLFWSLARIVYMPITTMSKDAMNGVFFVPLILCFVVMVRTSGRIFLQKKWFGAVFALLALLSILSKRPTMYVLAIAFVFYMGYELVHKRKVKGAKWGNYLLTTIVWPGVSFVVAVALATFAILPAINSALNVTHIPTKEMYSILEQQLTYSMLKNPEVFDAEDMAALDGIFDVEAAKDVYNPHRSDEVSSTYRINDDIISRLLPVYLEISTEAPRSYFDALMLLSGGWLSLQKPIDYGNYDWDDSAFEYFGAHFFGGDIEAAIEEMSKLNMMERPAWIVPLYKITNFLDRGIAKILPITCSYGLYCGFFPLLLLVWCLASRKWKTLVVAMVPMALLLSYVVGPIALYWYTVPMAYLTPLFLASPCIMASVESSRK